MAWGCSSKKVVDGKGMPEDLSLTSLGFRSSFMRRCTNVSKGFHQIQRGVWRYHVSSLKLSIFYVSKSLIVVGNVHAASKFISDMAVVGISTRWRMRWARTHAWLLLCHWPETTAEARKQLCVGVTWWKSRNNNGEPLHSNKNFSVLNVIWLRWCLNKCHKTHRRTCSLRTSFIFYKGVHCTLVKVGKKALWGCQMSENCQRISGSNHPQKRYGISEVSISMYNHVNSLLIWGS